MARPSPVRVLIYLLVIIGTCIVLISLRNNATSKNEEVEELVNAVKKLRSIAKSRGLRIEDVSKTDIGEETVSMNEEGQDMQKKKTNSSFLITEYWQASSLLKWDFEKPPEYNCKNKSSAGIYYICQDPLYTIKPPCIAYSFGVYTKWAFEETLGAMGCETHSFDPSVKMGDHIHKKVVNFHKLGIGAEDTDSFKPKRDLYVKDDTQRWKMRTLPSIMKMLGHEGKVIDVLKVDVEGWEWFMMQQMLDTGIIHRVRQFIVEWHLIHDFPKKDSYMDLLRIYYRMKDAGFRTFSIDFRFRGFSVQRWRIQSDMMYVNTKFNPNL